MIATTKTKTGLQSISILPSYDGELARDLTKFATYTDYRKLRIDPTVALGRGLLVSGVMSGAWSVEADEGVADDIVAAIEALLPLRDDIMQAAVAFGRVDFGWMGWEKVLVTKDGRITLDHLKPLLHDMTTILIDKNGHFKGYRQRNALTALPIDVPTEKVLHIAFDVEGGNLYGQPLLENIRATRAMWDECNAGAKRYDTKMAGTHFIVHYPKGTTTIDDEVVDNSEVAKRLLTALESSGSMAMPSTTAEVVQELVGTDIAKLYQWDVTLLSDTSPRQQ